MGLYESEGIVLRKYNLSDADRIAVVLTEKCGLIRGVAGGAKRLKSRFSSSLEFFSVIQLTFFRNEHKDLAIIRETELELSVFEHLSDADFYMMFGEIADLLVKMVPPYEPNKRLYGMTKHCLETAIADLRLATQTRLYFEIWLLKLSGFLPDWSFCSKCNTGLDGDVGFGLDIDFQLTCDDCGSDGAYITNDIRALFLIAQEKSAVAFGEIAFNQTEDAESLRKVVSAITDAVLERSPAGDVSFYKDAKDAA